MARARSNLTLAHRALGPGVLWEDLCFEVQQAAEKALKAVLIARGGRFRKTQDIGVLLTLLRESKVEVPPEILTAVDLTPYAFQSRYPSEVPLTEKHFEQAVALAEAVVAWAEIELSRKVA